MVMNNINGIMSPQTPGDGFTSTTIPDNLNPKKVQLSPGLSIWYGQLQEEYLDQLRPWTRLVKLYREMSDDAIIGALLEAIRTPLLSTSFIIHPASQDNQDIEYAKFLEDNIFNIPNQEWLEHVEDMLEFLVYGFSISEKVLEKKPNGKLYIRSLIPVGPETLDRWGTLDDYGDVTGFIQRHPQTGVRNAAPMEKLLHFTWRTRKRSPQGQSLLRSLYRPWYFKKNLETLEAIGIERDVGNVPIASLKQEFYGAGDEASRLTALKEALDNFRVDETAYIILPLGVEVEAYASGNKAYNIREVIRDWQHIIRQRFFADFLSLGSEQVGTQSLAKEMNTFFKLALTSIQRRMTEVWNKQLVPYLFKHNNIDIKDNKYPKIVWNDPASINIQSLAQAYGELVNVGLLRPTPLIQKHILEQLRLPIDEAALMDTPLVEDEDTVDPNSPDGVEAENNDPRMGNKEGNASNPGLDKKPTKPDNNGTPKTNATRTQTKG
jgi:phage gp29-like protein